MRTATVGTALPTEPILRRASAAGSDVVTGDISVWPNTETISTWGNVRAIVSSRLTLAGAAPHEIVRRVASGCAHSTCHWAGTRNRPVTRSDSTTSRVDSAVN